MDDAMNDAPGESGALAQVEAVAAREAASLDERRWDDWIALFTPDCEYWVPAWVDEERPSADPRTAISLIYYASRAGLEERVLRIRSGRSVAAMPLRRTMHQFTNFLVTGASAGEITARCSSSCHSYDPHTARTDVLYGATHYTLRRVGAGWKIARKKIVLLNDTLPSSVDVYTI